MRKIVVSFDAPEKRTSKEKEPVALKDVVESLERLRKKSGSNGVHFTMNNIHQTKGLTAVLAVYKDEQPVHQVLDKLYKWADETGQEDVKRKMEELKQDMKWNEDNPILTARLENSCNDLIGLVEPEIANSDYKLKEWLKEQAIKHIELASVEDVEIDNIEDVKITKETSDQYINGIIGDTEWKKIMKENRESE